MYLPAKEIRQLRVTCIKESFVIICSKEQTGKLYLQ